MKLGVEAEDINQGQNQPRGSGTPVDYKMITVLVPISKIWLTYCFESEYVICEILTE